jgi:hypothetical protein
MIAGRMRHHLADEKDLCVLAPPVEHDRLTRLLEGRFAFLFRLLKVNFQFVVFKLDAD